MVSVREFKPEDAAQASVVFFESFKTYLKERMETDAPRSAEYTENLMRYTINEDCESISFVAEEDGRIVGCITVNLALKRGLGCLVRIGVMPGNAGKGIGKMLFRAADDFWKKRQTRKVRTCVSSINPGALKFYESCGFHVEATLKDHFFPGVDEHQLALFY